MTAHGNSRVRCWKALSWSAGAAVLLACAGQGDSEAAPGLELDAVTPVSTAPDPEQMEAEFQAQAGASLSQHERAAVEARLRDIGVEVSRLRFAGRLVVLDDLYIDVDELLPQTQAEGGVLPKGRVFDIQDMQELPGRDSSSSAVKFAGVGSNGDLFFRRPDIDGLVIVIPNGAESSFLVSAFMQATTAIVNAANDCLMQIPVLTQSQVDAIAPEDLRFRKFIFVKYTSGEEACPADPTALACSLFPRNQFREFDIGLSTTRLVPGTRIAINNGEITPENVHADTLIHELLHTLGLAHPNDFADFAVVPGTDCSGRVSSIMQTESEGGRLNPNRARALTEDDDLTIGALYAGRCGYDNNPRDLGASVAPCR